MHIISIFYQFLLLGLSSFGGPAAHIGYFRHHFVDKKKWLDDSEYAQLIALSQFLPGPGSSQVGFALGLKKAGLTGGIAAFLGFTLPSFLIMYFIAILPANDNAWINTLIQSAKLLAVVVVLDAVFAMSKQFCKENKYQVIALLSAVTCLLAPHLLSQLGIIIGAAIIGAYWAKQPHKKVQHKFVKPKLALLLTTLVMVISSFFIAHPLSQMFAHFATAGTMVFGGGHVVLPLLQQLLENIPNEQFMLGYASAQGIPGPMFALASFLGVAQLPEYGIYASLVATLALFLPGLVLMYSILPSWQSLQQFNWCIGAVNAINAAVVGILGAALYQPIFTSAVNEPKHLALVLVGCLLIRQFKLPILALIAVFIGFGLLFL